MCRCDCCRCDCCRASGRLHLSASYSDVYATAFTGKQKVQANVLFPAVWSIASKKSAERQVQILWDAVVVVCQRFHASTSPKDDEAAFVLALVGGTS